MLVLPFAVHFVGISKDALLSVGMLWNFRDVLQILENLLWIAHNLKTTNEDFALQLPLILEELRYWMDANPSRFCDESKREDAIIEGNVCMRTALRKT